MMGGESSECIAGFEEKRRLTDGGVEFWLARELMPLLDYAKWANFKSVIDKARLACESAGFAPNNHFADAGKMVLIGSGAQREAEDLYLTRYACYLIAMNADPSKPQVGYAMTYFAAQTRRQEVLGQLTDEEKRVQLRLRVIDSNKRLAGAAKKAGVTRYPVFQAAGHQGLYGMSLAEVKTKKGLTPSEELLDNVCPLELSAHDFKANVTEHRLNQGVTSENRAIETHRSVGREIRQVMTRDGVNPEDLPRAASIKRIVRKRQKAIKSGDA